MTAEMSGASSLVPASASMSDALTNAWYGLSPPFAAPDAASPISSALVSNCVTIFWRICGLGLVGADEVGVGPGETLERLHLGRFVA